MSNDFAVRRAEICGEGGSGGENESESGERRGAGCGKRWEDGRDRRSGAQSAEAADGFSCSSPWRSSSCSHSCSCSSILSAKKYAEMRKKLAAQGAVRGGTGDLEG